MSESTLQTVVTAIQVTGGIALFIGFIYVLWSVRQHFARRRCPRCGRRVRVGVLDCGCGFDFRRVGA